MIQTDYSSNLSQAERLAYAANPIVIPADSIGHHERKGFVMPSMSKVREHDARLMAQGSSCNVTNDAGEDEEQDEESELRDYAYAKRTDSMREHSFRLPSQRGMREAYSEAYSYGYAND